MDESDSSVLSDPPSKRPSSKPSRLLLLGCARTKIQHPHLLPALERYDGPTFRLLRRYSLLRPDQSLRVHVLSAEFGLISAHELIPHYDRRMTTARACELRTGVAETLGNIMPTIDLTASNGANLLVLLGKDYLPALAGYDGSNATRLFARVAKGGQGRKLSVLYEWLYGTSPDRPRRTKIHDGPVKFRGIEMRVDANDVFAVARQSLLHDATDAYAVSTWYVEIDRRRVAVKWLMKQVTGRQVHQFSTSDALTFFDRLGIKVGRA